MSDEPQRPASNDDREKWTEYWKAQGVPWRTQPEIDEERQRFLAERRAVKPDIAEGVYPFKDIKLDRADVEWLLATHENGRGPIDWDDETQRERVGLDLRGAHVYQTNLSTLPLARAIGGLSLAEMSTVAAQAQALAAAAAHFEGVQAFDIDLRHSMLMGAQFAGVQFVDAHFERATLIGSRFERSRLHGPHFEGATLILATFEQVQAPATHFDGAALANVRAARADFFESHFEGADCNGAHFEGARFGKATLHGTNLSQARLEGAVLDGAHLEGKKLSEGEVAQLRVWRPDFPAVLEPTDMRGAVLDSESSVVGCTLGNEQMGGVSLADARIADVNLAVVEWAFTKRGSLRRHIEAIELGDEREARKSANRAGMPKSSAEQLTGYKDAVRAYRQLATALRSQGLNEDADRFAYKAQKLQRQVLRRQGRRGAVFGSWFLDLIAGYGYRPMRSFITYLLVVVGFAAIYFVLRDSVHPSLNPLDSIIFSITSFHGRGFSPGEVVALHNPLTIFAALEAIIGLLIEITFIATFTQRFFAR
jgi:uncharacterized protein YjbI with pentapeptide repeats